MAITGERPGPAPGERRRLLTELATFFGLAFGITWGIGAVFLFARPQLEAVIGPMGALNHHWLYFVAVCAPTISALACSLIFGGPGGLKALGGRFLRPTSLLWFAVAILIWPAAVTVFALVAAALGRADMIDLHALWVRAPILATTSWALVIDPGGLGEETGWRGYAFPRLVALARPAWAAMGLGVIWSLWHLPAFFVDGLAQSQFNLVWFIVGGVALSVVMAWLYVRGNGNVIVAGVIPHLMWNLTYDAKVFRGDVLPREVTVMVAMAVILVAVFGPGLAARRLRATPRSAT